MPEENKVEVLKTRKVRAGLHTWGMAVILVLSTSFALHFRTKCKREFTSYELEVANVETCEFMPKFCRYSHIVTRRTQKSLRAWLLRVRYSTRMWLDDAGFRVRYFYRAVRRRMSEEHVFEIPNGIDLSGIEL